LVLRVWNDPTTGPKDGNSTLKNDQGRQWISYHSKRLSHVKQIHIIASPVKFIFCALYPLKIGEIFKK